MRLRLAPAVLLTGLLAGSAAAQSADDLEFVLTRALYPVQLMAYCWREVETDEAFTDAADVWNDANHGLLANLEDLGAEAGVSAEARAKSDRETLETIKATVTGQQEPADYCVTIARLIREGRFDIDRRDDLEEPLKRIFGLD